MPWRTLQHYLNEIYMVIQTNEDFKIPGLLQNLLPGYHPSSEVLNWANKAEKRKD
jgi:hypothetical protein